MIEIVSLLVGLLSGPQPLTVAVGPAVAGVEVRLDGAPVAEMAAPPWSAVVDLGPDLAVHRLEVVARDSAGGRLGSARRWINRPPADAAAAGEGGMVVAVLDPATREPLAALLEARRKRLISVGLDAEELPRLLLPLGPADRLRLLSPVTTAGTENAPRDLFADSPYYELDRPGIRSRGFSYYLPRWWPEPVPPRLADAVCLAGWQAAAGGGSRAVLLVADPASSDASLYSPAEARRYLNELGVPLRVWTPAADPGPLAAAWGEVESVGSWPALESATEALRSLLEAPPESRGAVP